MEGSIALDACVYTIDDPRCASLGGVENPMSYEQERREREKEHLEQEDCRAEDGREGTAADGLGVGSTGELRDTGLGLGAGQSRV